MDQPEPSNTSLDSQKPKKRLRFSLRTLLLISLSIGSVVTLGWNWEPWIQTHILRGHQGGAYRAAFSPDGLRVATTPSYGPLRIWDVHTGALRHSGPETDRSDVKFTDDGRCVKLTSSRAQLLYDLKVGQGVDYSYSKTRHESYPYIKSSRGHSVYLMGHIVEIGHLSLLRKECRGHDKPVWDAVFSPDETLLLTVAEDNTARLWNVDDGKALKMFEGFENPLRAGFSQDQKSVFVQTSSEFILWNLENGNRSKFLFQTHILSFGRNTEQLDRTLPTLNHDGSRVLFPL